jgi:hypothetical protein
MYKLSDNDDWHIYAELQKYTHAYITGEFTKTSREQRNICMKHAQRIRAK